MSDDETVKRAEKNAAIGRTYYQALTDAEGYPNGMPFWPEMDPRDKYYYSATGLDFLEKLSRDEVIAVPDDIGFRDPVRYGEGDCGALLELFRARQAAELREFETRIESMSAAYSSSRKDDE